ncbi:MAG: hypothetical protein VW495_03695, partial [Rhodobiaceae bacterium]
RDALAAGWILQAALDRIHGSLTDPA